MSFVSPSRGPPAAAPPVGAHHPLHCGRGRGCGVQGLVCSTENACITDAYEGDASGSYMSVSVSVSVGVGVSRCDVLASGMLESTTDAVLALFQREQPPLRRLGALPSNAVQPAGLAVTAAGNVTLTVFVFLPAAASVPDFERWVLWGSRDPPRGVCAGHDSCAMRRDLHDAAHTVRPASSRACIEISAQRLLLCTHDDELMGSVPTGSHCSLSQTCSVHVCVGCTWLQRDCRGRCKHACRPGFGQHCCHRGGGRCGGAFARVGVDFLVATHLACCCGKWRCPGFAIIAQCSWPRRRCLHTYAAVPAP